MSRRSFIVSIFLLVFGTISEASAQSPNGFMNIFNAMMGAAIVNNARVEWSKVPASQTECIEERLQQRGASIGSLIQNGIVPNDPRIAGVRFDCRTAAVTPPTASPNSDPAESPNPDTVDVGRLSETPTFDCTPARSLTARTICADRAGASADWDLITAYWARYFSIARTSEKLSTKPNRTGWVRSTANARERRILPNVSSPPITAGPPHIARNSRAMPSRKLGLPQNNTEGSSNLLPQKDYWRAARMGSLVQLPVRRSSSSRRERMDSKATF
jgi:hypothetical protein